MNVRRTVKKGFTLIEILIVVIILGILAAIVIPQFTSASTEAREGNLKSQLQTLRSQIALYKLQHGDTPPAETTFWSQMTQYSNDAGGTNATKTATHKFGPYYDAAVINPLTNSSSVVAAAAAGAGWVYNETTGKVQAVAKDGTVFVETN